MPYEQLAIIDFTDDDAEADRRADHFRDRDPYPDVPRALLSKENVSDYVRVTGMLCPFYPTQDRLKAASYEAWPKRFIRWDERGRKIVHEIDLAAYEANGYLLPANSITFVQIESKIRLPNYMALRFNLRITHVHRGLLLGTGPLVDPGFCGELLIPLHNLTSDDYVMRGGVIWIEFTKTSQDTKPPEDFNRKKNVGFETYFERASKNNPIQSSIPKAIIEAQRSAGDARKDARSALRANRFFASLGFLALLGMIFAAANFGISLEKDSGEARREADLAYAQAQRNNTDVDSLRRDLQAARQSLSDMQASVQTLRQEVDALKQRP